MNKYTNYPSLCDIIKNENIVKINSYIDKLNNNMPTLECVCNNGKELQIHIEDDKVAIYNIYFNSYLKKTKILVISKWLLFL